MFEQEIDYEPYILNDNNMLSYLKYKVIKSNIVNKPNNIDSKNERKYGNITKRNN